MQEIVADEKEHLDNDQVKMVKLKDTWEEFAVSNVWKLVRTDMHLRSYLPADEMDAGRYVDRDFFWGIAFTVCRTWAYQYVRQAIARRKLIPVHDFKKKKTIIVSTRWA